MVGIGQDVDIHEQLRHYPAHGISMIAMRVEIAHYGKGDVSEEHETEQLGIVIPDERQYPRFLVLVFVFIFHHQSSSVKLRSLAVRKAILADGSESMYVLMSLC